MEQKVQETDTASSQACLGLAKGAVQTPGPSPQKLEGCHHSPHSPAGSNLLPAPLLPQLQPHQPHHRVLHSRQEPTSESLHLLFPPPGVLFPAVALAYALCHKGFCSSHFPSIPNTLTLPAPLCSPCLLRVPQLLPSNTQTLASAPRKAGTHAVLPTTHLGQHLACGGPHLNEGALGCA